MAESMIATTSRPAPPPVRPAPIVWPAVRTMTLYECMLYGPVEQLSAPLGYLIDVVA